MSRIFSGCSSPIQSGTRRGCCWPARHPEVRLLVHCDLVADEGLVVDLHFVEEPVRIALQDFRQVDADVAGWFTESVHDAAQGGLMDSQHAGQAVLANTGGVHAQLQVWIDVTIQGHSSARFAIGVAAI